MSVKISDYERGERIGGGAYGDVFIVQEKKTGKEFACKINKQELSEDTTTEFINEVVLMAQVNHPAIVKFIGFSCVDFDEKHRPIIISELVRNGALQKMIDKENNGEREPKWTNTKKMINIIGLAAGLKHLHDIGITHRDFKPANVLLNDNYEPKICDFGISKKKNDDQESLMETFTGTPIYMAPEIMKGEPYDKTVDVYSYSVVVYQIITSITPFKGQKTCAQLYNKVINGLRPDLSAIQNEAYSRLLSKCWDNNPENRPSFEEILNELLNKEEFMMEEVDCEELADYLERLSLRSSYCGKINNAMIGLQTTEEQRELMNKMIEEGIGEEEEDTFLRLLIEMKKINNLRIEDLKRGLRIVNKKSIEGNDKATKLLEEFYGKYIVPYGTREIEAEQFKRFQEERVNIPPTVTKIGERSFSESSIRYINIPPSVIEICNSSFYKCESLESIYIPNSVTFICNSAFNMCTSLKSIDIPNSVTSIGDSAFSGCKSLESIDIPNSVTSIGITTFNGCSSLKSIDIPNSVTSIGNSAFSGCKSLESINIPDYVTFIDEKAFNSCTSLKSIVIPNSITSIGNSAFKECKSLESINIPDYVTFIGEKAFNSCTSLKSIVIPDFVTHIGDSAFSWCTSLRSIKIPDSVDSISNFSFSVCKALESVEIPISVTSIGEHAFNRCESLISIKIPQSVTSIKSYAFYKCKSLKSIEIPDSVSFIGDYAFEECPSLKEVKMSNPSAFLGKNAIPSNCIIC